MMIEHPEPLKPIKGLKPGEKLRRTVKGYLAFPEVGEYCIVADVYPEEKLKQTETGAPLCRFDFTAFIQTEDGNILEFEMDSRYFERE